MCQSKKGASPAGRNRGSRSIAKTIAVGASAGRRAEIRPTWGAPRSILAHKLTRASRLRLKRRALPRTSNADGSTISTTLTATGVAADIETAIFYAFLLRRRLWALCVAATKPTRDVPERQRRTSLPWPVILTGFRSRLCVQLRTR